MNSETKEMTESSVAGELSLKELISKIGQWWKYLLSKWMIIITFGISGGALGFAYAYITKPIYNATTTFVLENSEGGGGLGQYAGLASMVGVDIGGTGGGIFQGDNILELYKSRTMLVKTLLTQIEVGGSKELLVDRYIQFNNLKEKWKKESILQGFEFVSIDKKMKANNRLQDSILGTIVQDINKNYLSVIKPDKKQSLIKVDVRAKDELFAKSFNDELVKNVNEFYITTVTRKSQQNVQILQHKTDSVRAVMNGAIYTAVAVADATPNLNPTRQVQRAVPTQRAQFSAETNKGVLEELVKNLEMSKISLMKETPLIQVVDQPVFPLTSTSIGKVKGFFIGFSILTFLTVLTLICMLLFKNLLKD